MGISKERAVTVSQEMISPGIYSMWIEEPGIAKNAAPGQFVSVYAHDRTKLLPRPISICETEPFTGKFRIVYRVTGPDTGTAEFASYRKGDPIDILGPLGNGFPLPDKKAMLIGGGIGIPPMLGLAKAIKCEKYAVLGYRDSDMFLKDDIEKYAEVFTATEDGSSGTKGTVIDAIMENGLSADVIYACGPMPMLRAVKEYAAEGGIECYISLEERMACGIGACLSCVCQTRDIDEHNNVRNARICKDGPVFESSRVELLSREEQAERIESGRVTSAGEGD